MKPAFLRGATAVITGAGSGIGRATALTFARHGATLVLAARRPEALVEVAACEHLGARALAVPTDVAVQQLVAAALAFGSGLAIGLAILINKRAAGPSAALRPCRWPPTSRLSSSICWATSTGRTRYCPTSGGRAGRAGGRYLGVVAPG
jgi:NAD(P)-dependent dehydrogenase (short-subunit alcohol dehydrogenase family)